MTLRGHRGGVVLLLVCVLVMGCAKKMAPPSPDRFAPRLAEIRTLNRVRVELRFDEPLDPSSVVADSFSVLGPDGAPLQVRGAVQGRRSDRVELWTWPQRLVVYEVRAVVRDAEGNVGRIRGRFRGSSRIDTIPPRVTDVRPAPGCTGQRALEVRLSFNEPIDTTARPEFLFVPSELDSVMQPSWDADWQTLVLTRPALRVGRDDDAGQPGRVPADSAAARALVPGDSLVPADSAPEPEQLVYFVLFPTVADLEGNRMLDAAFTYFTNDSVFEADLVHGRAVWREGLLGTGVVFFDTGPAVGLTSVNHEGTFATRLKPGTYGITAVSDTDGDGLVDLVCRVDSFATAAESLDLIFQPETLPQPIHGYRR